MQINKKSRFKNFTRFELYTIYQSINLDLPNMYIKDIPENLLSEIKSEIENRDKIDEQIKKINPFK